MVDKKIYKIYTKNICLGRKEEMDSKFIEFAGTIFIDRGAANAKNGKSLLAAGIKSISGKFEKGREYFNIRS